MQAGISKSEVLRICARLDERLTEFRNRTLGHVGSVYVLNHPGSCAGSELGSRQGVAAALRACSGTSDLLPNVAHMQSVQYAERHRRGQAR